MTSNGIETPSYAANEFQQQNNGENTERSYAEQSELNENQNPNKNDFMKYNEVDNLKQPVSHTNGQESNRSDNNNKLVINRYASEQIYQEPPQHTGQKSQSLSLEYGKTIRLLRNGDEFFRGHKFVINSRKYKYFNVFMDDISNDLNANFGAIRKIHTPVNGHRINSLDQMEDGKTYVAAGNTRFIKINYTDVLEGRRPAPNNRLPAIDRTEFNVRQYDTPQNALIYVYRNGDILTPPFKILLYKTTMISYNAVLDEISSKVKLPNGAVFKLFSMNGELVTSSAGLQTGHSYVAAHKERFKRVDYFALPEFGSPRNARKTNEETKLTPNQSIMAAKSENSQPSYASSSSSKASSYGKPNGWYKRKENSYPNSLPPVRLQKNRVNVNVDVDKDENGLYKARNKYNDNADTIEDAPNMYVDMPVDYKRTEQVDDEFMNEHKARNQKPPINSTSQNQISKPNSKQLPKERTPSPKPIFNKRSPSPLPIIKQTTPSPQKLASPVREKPDTPKTFSPDLLPQTQRDNEPANTFNDQSMNSLGQKPSVDYYDEDYQKASQVASDNQFSSARNDTPIRSISPPREATPARAPSPPREPTPAREPSPPREATPAREISPPREATPAREPSPPREATPAREPSPPREATPAREISPPREATPQIADAPLQNEGAEEAQADKVDITRTTSDEVIDDGNQEVTIKNYMTVEQIGEPSNESETNNEKSEANIN